MLVWESGQSGTIGGGALELMAAQRAFAEQGLTRHALGPELGQCCGGAVMLLTEVFDAAWAQKLAEQTVFARGPGQMPLAVRRLLDAARGRGASPAPRLVGDWMIEPIAPPRREIWIWGAGHVGRALVGVLAPVPGLAVTWVDTAPDRFPDPLPDGVTPMVAARPEILMPHAPPKAEHIILTYSHEIDLSLCHAVLSHEFRFAGVIGSDTKWARFRNRLRTTGHKDAEIERICCPIGQKSLGKSPQAIAIGVAAQLLETNKKELQSWQTRSSALAG
jgi:xanthine dehydrogenase accessory factor